MATGTTQANDGMPHTTGTTDKVGNAAQKISDLDREINAKIDKYVDTRDDVLKHISMLPQRQCEVLCLMYIEKRETVKPGQGWYYSWREIAHKMGCTEQNVSKLRRKAIKNLQKIIDSH